VIPELYTAINDVRACEVASDGKVTIATSGGLATLSSEGKLERLLTALDGLPDGRLHTMQGSWIGTEKGAALLENGKVSRVFGKAPVRAILSNASETYFGTWGSGVQKLSGGDIPFAVSNPARLRVSSLAMHDGALVAGTAAGTFRLENGKLASYGSTSPTFALATVGDRLFIGGFEGLSSIAKGVLRHESDSDVRALSVENNKLLIGTFGRGASTLESAKFVSAIAPRCVGTADGVFVKQGEKWSHFAKEGLPSPDISAVAIDGNKIYVGTFDRGLAVIENGKVKRIEGVDKQINALAIDGGNVWVGTARGLYRIGKDTKRYTEVDGIPSADIHALASLKGRVLVGTSRGAAIVGTTIEPLGKKQNVTGDAVWAVAEHEGELWLGTNAGLFIGKPGQTFRRLSKLTGELNDDWVTAIAFNGKQAYVGTYAGGVTELTSGKRLGGGYINPDGLRIINGKVYAATMEGLLVDFQRQDKNVLGTDVTAVTTSPKGLIIATRRGLTIS
jgi:hypothetical protein